ncbi:hypothetical protein PVK06_024645 [Gossypium arboreum]|uniref:Uncharacterized protein n=1 Tax=Gossypium arboreum TaxID=29729 RepID=A0ABR0PEH4_GOSAR|nr:hypothetical protein PVK06_024645 [Gossypium arboreum]
MSYRFFFHKRFSNSHQSSPLRRSSSSFFSIQAFMLQSFMLILTKSLLLRKIISMASLLSGSQAVVSFVLQQELHAEFSLVAKEDSKDLRKDGAQEIIKRITKLVNDSLTSDGSYNVTLSQKTFSRPLTVAYLKVVAKVDIGF